MTYIEKLNPWCIVCHFPSMQHQIVARFRRRSDAEAHSQALHRLIPTKCNFHNHFQSSSRATRANYPMILSFWKST
ncbi:hypothetical protein [Nostoc sp.]|uniref:hypothetical protein n=1 Tax=Nostoc sp. TaxID=1180 RepID=UPI002FF6EA26